MSPRWSAAEISRNQALAEFVPVVQSALAQGDGDSENPAFPRLRENRFAVAARNRGGTVEVGGNAIG